VNLGGLRTTQAFALLVAAVVVAVLVFLFATGRFESDDDEDPLALETETSEQEQGGDGDASAGDGGESAAEGEGVAVVASGGVALEEAFQVGDLRLLITESRRGSLVGENRDNVNALGQFVVISLTARNTGATPVLLGERVSLLDAARRSYSPVPEASATAALRDPVLEDALAVELQPGLTVDLVVVFDVPEGADGLLLRVVGGFVDVALSE
jgi:hypothetical protein